MFMCVIKIRRHQHTRVHAHTQARSAMPELRRVTTDTTSNDFKFKLTCFRRQAFHTDVYARVLVPPNLYIRTYIHCICIYTATDPHT